MLFNKKSGYVSGVLLVVLSLPLCTRSAVTASAQATEDRQPQFASKEEARKIADASMAEGLKLRQKQNSEAYRAAMEKFQQAAVAYEFAGDRDSQSIALASIGMIQSTLGQPQEALANFNRALPIFREVGDRFHEAITLNNIANVYKGLGDTQDALKYFNQALPIVQKLGNRGMEGTLLTNIGAVYNDVGKNQEALQYYNHSLAIFHDAGMRNEEAITFNNVGRVYVDLGQLQKALEYYTQALPILREVKNRESEASVLSNIGVTYNALNQPREALKYYNQALPILRETGRRAAEATVLNNIGRVYSDLGELQQALEYYNQALPILREVGEAKTEAVTLNNIAGIYQSRVQLEEALSYYSQALLVQQKLGNRDDEATTLNNLGTLYTTLKRNQEALQSFEHALTIVRELGNPQTEAITLSNLMDFFSSNDVPLAIVFGKQSVNVSQELRRNISGLSKELQQSFVKSKEETYRQLADLLISRGRLWEAQQVLDLLKDEEYFGFIQRGKPETSTRPVPLAPADAEPLIAMDKEYSTLAAREEQQLTAAEKDRKAYLQQQLKAAKIAAAQFFDEAGRVRAPQNGQNGGGAALDEEKEAVGLQKDLGPDTVAVYTLVSKDSFHALLITPTARKRWDYRINAAELRKKVMAFRENLRDPKRDPLPLARELYRIIIGDLDKELAAANANTILWSLDDVLRYIPMAALNDGNQYLAERFRNVVYSKGSSRAGGSFQSWRALGAGVSESRDNLPALDSVPGELRAIIHDDADPKATGVLPGKILLNPNFTAAAFRAGLHQNYPVIHIASHFVFSPGVDDGSFLLLGSGKLTLAELRENDDYTFRGVQLLTLSACDTAAGSTGDGREIDGLGFLAEEKGARAVIATLWDVADNSTGIFMRHFYQQLSQGKTKAESLQQAELTLLRGEIESQDGMRTIFAHPYFWAPFILLGNGN